MGRDAQGNDCASPGAVWGRGLEVPAPWEKPSQRFKNCFGGWWEELKLCPLQRGGGEYGDMWIWGS